MLICNSGAWGFWQVFESFKVLRVWGFLLGVFNGFESYIIFCTIKYIISRVTENSVSIIKFYRVFHKIYERWSEDIW